MRTNKPGLADLKKLRQAALTPEKPKNAGKPSSVAGKRRPGKSGTAAAQTAAGAQGSAALPASIAAEKTPLGADDRALFRQAVKSVRPIKDSRRAVLQPVPAAASAMLRQRRESAVGQEQAKLAQVSDHYSPPKLNADESSFLRTGAGPDLIKLLKKGKWPIEASLDLHGATQDEARIRLDQFLSSCLAHNIKCVRIVHGKGYGSKDGAPVLKETVRRWLSQLDAVNAYTECAEADGGAGAVQVLLRGENS